MAKRNKYLDTNLYAGHIDEDEVQHMIEMLKINIIGYDSTHQMQEHWWKPYITQPYLDVDFKGDLLLHRTLIMDNTLPMKLITASRTLSQWPLSVGGIAEQTKENQYHYPTFCTIEIFVKL